MATPSVPRLQPTAGDTNWFTHDRFGLFIHWGLYSLAARHEWVKQRERIRDEDYQRYFDHFDPDLYDPQAWARMAREAGMRYVVITTKHHEGFCLWNSDLTDYKAPNTPAGRDLLRPFVDAFRAEGLRVGFYYSLIDWHHPEFPVDGLHPQRDEQAFIDEVNPHRDVRKYATYLRGQVRELLTQYGPVDIMWFDFSYPDWVWGGKGGQDWQSEDLLRMVRELAPNVIVNDRLDLPGAADVYTPEQYQPRGWVTVEGRPVVWEACQTFNGSWGYDRDNLDWKPPALLVRLLIDSVAKGGNLLLNVGPNARGAFEPRAIETLRALGDWTRLHSRAIYGATASALLAPADCRLTQRGNRLYVHLFSWPFKHLHLDGLRNRVMYAQLLHDGSEVRATTLEPFQRRVSDVVSDRARDTLMLELPIQRPDVLVPVIELFLRD